MQFRVNEFHLEAQLLLNDHINDVLWPVTDSWSGLHRELETILVDIGSEAGKHPG